MAFASMIMAFFAMIMAFLAIIIGILLFMLVLGLIFLIAGVVKRRNPDNKGKKHPTVFIIIGSLLSLPTLVIIIMVLVATLISNNKTSIETTQYECVPDKWRSEYVNDNEAAQEVFSALLKSADEGDSEAFAKNFTPKLQNDKEFDDALKDFFSSYPGGFSEHNIDVGLVGGEGSYNYGHNVLTASTDIDFWIDGEWYTISLAFCYENTDNPDEVGVTEFILRNLEADAVFRDNFKNEHPREDKYLACNIMSSDEVSARLIGGESFLWTDTKGPKLTEDEMRMFISDHNGGDIKSSEIIDVIGEPNASSEAYAYDEYYYYYELKPKSDGTPLYVCIRTENFCRIREARVCDSDEEYYDNPILE